MSHLNASSLELAVLDPLSGPVDVEKRAAEALERGAALCVSPHLLSSVPETELRVVSVCGFPHGTHHPLIKATEARFAVQNGAVEIALVPNLGAIQSGDMNLLLGEIVAVREAITEHIKLTVILEAAAFTKDQVITAAETAARAGADYLQTSTGYHPAGVAPVELLNQLKAILPVKATTTSEEMVGELLDAGAIKVLLG